MFDLIELGPESNQSRKLICLGLAAEIFLFLRLLLLLYFQIAYDWRVSNESECVIYALIEKSFSSKK